MRLAQPALLIDISRSAELSTITVTDGAVRVGAAVAGFFHYMKVGPVESKDDADDKVDNKADA